MRAICASALTFLLTVQASALPVTIKLAAQIPENSPIGHGIIKLAGEWKRLSGGNVLLKPYLGGSLGDDESMRQKMNTGFIDAAVLTSSGLAPLVPEFMALSAPSLVRSQDEVPTALAAIKPLLDRGLEEKGFKALAITMGGWVRFFSREPLATPAELKAMRFALSPYDSNLWQLFKVMGVNVVTVPSTTLLQKFQSKSVDVMYSSPVYMSYQWSSYSKSLTSMLDLPICPFLGCVIVRQASWDRVPAALRQALTEATEAVAAEIEAEMISKEESVIKDLSNYGLRVVKPSPAQSKDWMEEFTAALENDKEEAFPREAVGLIRKALAERRQGGR